LPPPDNPHDALFRKTFSNPEHAAAELRAVLPDISHLSDDQLAARALGMLPTLTLWALREARRPNAVRRSLSRWASVMQQLAAAESGREALLTVGAIFRWSHTTSRGKLFWQPSPTRHQKSRIRS
jgi:hypothetical protein